LASTVPDSPAMSAACLYEPRRGHSALHLTRSRDLRRRSGLLDRFLGLRLFVGVVLRLIPAFKRSSELADPRAEGASDLGKAAWPEQDQNHHSDDQQMDWVL
jgi:hypothetical protein